ncbi:rho GTPase-activating protein 21 isoform X3 [Culicoides brevitarsis]|uniref:rho GTPase-activating protein 21 isoform X3 n=1 Tax=Culicoides brevitarsis TaxID=469753 RepID=UPI00307B4452
MADTQGRGVNVGIGTSSAQAQKVLQQVQAAVQHSQQQIAPPKRQHTIYQSVSQIDQEAKDEVTSSMSENQEKKTQNMSTSSPGSTNVLNGPRTVVLHRINNDFGFTLRHFIVYPPESCTEPSIVGKLAASGSLNFAQPMDTVFVKKVHPNSSAYKAGLREGDRLLAVNGMHVAGTTYAQVVSVIQQTPKTLTLQVVPKNYDILQRFFGDTAHNPETNTRHSISGKNSSIKPIETLSDKQESLYSTLQSIASPNNSNNIYSEPQSYPTPKIKLLTESMTQTDQRMSPNIQIRVKGVETDKQNRESGSSISTSFHSYDSQTALSNTGDTGDNAIISRIRKSCEQKEEFLRRPSQPYAVHAAGSSPLPLHSNISSSRQPIIFENVVASAQHPQHREFYSRPNRLQKAMWPPTQETTVSPKIDDEFKNHMSIREQFFTGIQQQDNDQHIRSSPLPFCPEDRKNMEATENEKSLSNRKDYPQLRLVSELTKQFSSGRPLSPDGVDRTSLYRSELSRLQTKQVHPNVALRKREFELKAESDHWRRSIDKTRSSSVDSESNLNASIRARSLSAESGRTSKNDDLPIPPPREKHRDRHINKENYDSKITSDDGTMVKLRQKAITNLNANNDSEDNKTMRRISYLRATQGTSNDGNNFNIMDNEFASVNLSPADGYEVETPNDIVNVHKTIHRSWRRPRFPTDIQPIRKLFEDSPPNILLPPVIETAHATTKHFFPQSHSTKDKALTYFRDTPADPALPATLEGVLRIKITVLDGKRSSDRSWRTVHSELKGNRLKFTLLREGKVSQSPEPSGIIDLTNFHLTDGNYTKRKHVFKLTTSSYPHGSSSVVNLKTSERELLLQAESDHDMKLWINVLRGVCRSNSATNMSNEFSRGGGQLAEPQTMPAIQSVQLSGDEISPILSNKTQRKYTFESRSPSGQSPVTKSRKTPLTPNVASGTQRDGSDKETGSPKTKTWKGIVARQFRRIGGAHSQESIPTEGLSFGVPLHMCLPSLGNPYVPMILARCIDIVEARGLSIVGIYRIPGNTAAIAQLTEQVNRGMDDQTLNDPRWEDVNVVSSLLKSFIRNLPEPILPLDTYNRFIEADKLPGAERLKELKALLKKLPPHNYETLKHLIRHLHRVSQNCLVNLMEPRNLAIVFGPSVIRSANETLATAVKDMRHQCQIVEALVSHFPFFFENDSLPDINETIQSPLPGSTLETHSKNLLLNNVQKIESQPMYKESKEHSSRFVANIVQAANRKIRRTAQRKSNISSTISSADTVSLDSTTSADSKGQHKLNYMSDCSSGNNKIPHMNTSRLSETVNPSSEDDSNDSAFNDNGSMSLKTITATLDNKLRTLRNSNIDTNCSATSKSEPLSDKKGYPGHLRPLTLGENIPFADESPERPLIQPRAKPLRVFNNSSTLVLDIPKSIDDSQPEISSSSDTDTSTTSNPREKNIGKDDIRNEMREMSRILFNLERKASNLERKIHLNRSLSLNYKNHKNNECCCRTLVNNTLGTRSHLSLTKDEKTDKNINKRRQLQDSNLSPSNSAGQIISGNSISLSMGKSRRHGGKDRSIRRRHTVGGSNDYYLTNKYSPTNDCERYIVTDTSSNTLKIDD